MTIYATDYLGQKHLVEKSALLTATTLSQWSIPANLHGDAVEVNMVAGGGSGERNSTDPEGGSGGETIQRHLYDLTSHLGDGHVEYQCGQGGAGSTSNPQDGNTGGDTTFGTLTVGGGSGGNQAGGKGTPPGMAAPGPYGGQPGRASASTTTFRTGGGGLIFDDTHLDYGSNGNNGTGWGAGSAGKSGSTDAGVQGAILLRWKETVS